MLRDACNSDTSTVISEGCGEHAPCCASCTSDALYAEIHPGSSVKELYRRAPLITDKLSRIQRSSAAYAQSRTRLKKSASRLAYPCKHYCHHRPRAPLRYDLYVLKSEDTDTDTSRGQKDVEVRKARSNGVPTVPTARPCRRVVPLKKPSVLCVRMLQPESSILRHKYSRPRNCRLCHHHYCSWMKEDLLHSRNVAREKKSASTIPEEQESKKNISSPQEPGPNMYPSIKKSYVENEFHSVASELNALLSKCEKEIVGKAVSEQVSSRIDPLIAAGMQPRVPLSLQRKLKEQLRQTRELPGHPESHSAGTQTRRGFNSNDSYETNLEERWHNSKQNLSQKCASSRGFGEDRNSLGSTSEADSQYYTKHTLASPPQQKMPLPRNSPHGRNQQREKVYRDRMESHEKHPQEDSVKDQLIPCYEQDLQFRRGSQGDGPISSTTSTSPQTVIQRKTSPKRRKSRIDSLKNPGILPYSLEPQSVFLASCDRQHCASKDHSLEEVKRSPRSSREQRNKWRDSHEFRQQEGHATSETSTEVNQAISAETCNSTNPQNKSQALEGPGSPIKRENAPGKGNQVLSEMLQDLESYLGCKSNDPKHQQENVGERGGESKSASENENTTQEKSCVRESTDKVAFKSRSLTTLSFPTYQTQSYDPGPFQPRKVPVGPSEEGKDTEEENSSSMHSSKSRITSVIDTAVQRELRAYADRSPDMQHKQVEDGSPSEERVKTKPIDTIPEMSSKQQKVQASGSVLENASSTMENTSCAVTESFSDWPDIYKMGSENNAMYQKLISALPGEEADYIRELRKLQWNHLSRIKEEIQSLEELVRFLDSYGSEHAVYTTHSSPT